MINLMLAKTDEYLIWQLIIAYEFIRLERAMKFKRQNCVNRVKNLGICLVFATSRWGFDTLIQTCVKNNIVDKILSFSSNSINLIAFNLFLLNCQSYIYLENLGIVYLKKMIFWHGNKCQHVQHVIVFFLSARSCFIKIYSFKELKWILDVFKV